jgi:hypothetical protein
MGEVLDQFDVAYRELPRLNWQVFQGGDLSSILEDGRKLEPRNKNTRRGCILLPTFQKSAAECRRSLFINS